MYWQTENADSEQIAPQQYLGLDRKVNKQSSALAGIIAHSPNVPANATAPIQQQQQQHERPWMDSFTKVYGTPC